MCKELGSGRPRRQSTSMSKWLRISRFLLLPPPFRLRLSSFRGRDVPADFQIAASAPRGQLQAPGAAGAEGDSLRRQNLEPGTAPPLGE